MTDTAITRAKNHLKGQLVLSMESPGARMQSLGRAVLLEQPVLTVDEVLERIDAVDRDAVIAAVRRYYDPETRGRRPASGHSRSRSGPSPRSSSWEER